MATNSLLSGDPEDSMIFPKTPPEVIAKVHSGALEASMVNAPIKKLLIASLLCFTFMMGELAGGVIANSLAILTDAAHLLSDLLGFAISIFAVMISRRPASSTTSYGYHRTEVLGALASISLIWALTIVLIYEAFQRVINPEKVDGLIMLITACCGFVINILLTKVLHHGHGHGHGHGHDHGHDHGHAHEEHDEHEHSHTPDTPESQLALSIQSAEAKPKHSKKHIMNLNVKAALIHVIGDLVQSIGVMIAAAIIYFQPEWSLADPICTFLFSILVIFTTVPILKECLNILLEQTPGHVNINNLIVDLEGIHGVIEMHDLHVWSLSAGKTSLSCHLQSESPSITLKKATKLCKKKYNICHTTIQVEPMGEGEAVVDCSNSLH